MSIGPTDLLPTLWQGDHKFIAAPTGETYVSHASRTVHIDSNRVATFTSTEFSGARSGVVAIYLANTCGTHSGCHAQAARVALESLLIKLRCQRGFAMVSVQQMNLPDGNAAG